MNTKKDRLNEVYEHLRKYFGVHTKKDFADALKINQAGLYSAMNGNDSYLTKSLFQKICAAFPGVFDLNYLLTGEGDLLTLEEEVSSDELKKQMSQQPNQSSATEQTYIMSKMVESILKPIEAAHAQAVASLQQQIAAKDELIAAKDETIASLRQQLAIMSSQLHQQQLRDWPFETGVADKPDTPRAQV